MWLHILHACHLKSLPAIAETHCAPLWHSEGLDLHFQPFSPLTGGSNVQSHLERVKVKEGAAASAAEASEWQCSVWNAVEFLMSSQLISEMCLITGLVFVLLGMWTEQQGAQEAQNASWSQPQITSLGRRAEYLVGRIFHQVISFKVPNT